MCAIILVKWFEITKCELEEFLEEASFHEIIKREKWKVESELGNLEPAEVSWNYLLENDWGLDWNY